MLAHYRRLHNALAVDHCAQATGPGGIDQRGGDGATVKSRVIAVCQHAVISNDDTNRRVKLAEAAQHPILASFFIVTFDAHGTKQLLGDANLTVAMLPSKGLADTKFTGMRHAR